MIGRRTAHRTVSGGSGTLCWCPTATRWEDRCGLVRSGANRDHAARVPSSTSRPMVRSGSRRVAAHMTSRTEAPDALVIPPGRIAPGRARGVPPPRREGPAKLTGTAMYTDDLVVPGAWYGATIRSTDAHARFLALDQDPDFDWSSVVLVTAADIPGENIVSSIKADQPVLVPIGGEIQHHAEPLALLAAADRGTLRAARRAIRPRTEPLPRDLRPARLGARVRDLHHRERRGRGGDGRGGPRPRGRVPGGPPGAALHREQRDDRGPARRRRRGHHGLAPVPVLRPHRAQEGPRDRRPAGPGHPGRDRRRLRRQGGVPLGHRPPRRAPRPEGPAAGPDDLRPPRGHRGHDQAPPRDRPPPDRRDQRRPDPRAGHRGRDGRRRVLHAHAGGPEPRRDPLRRPVPLPERPDPGPRDAHEHAAQRGVPRLRGAAGRVRGRDPPEPDRRAPRHLAARDPPAERLPPR